jgi:tRNA/tmRNA/rRNA uracil-C5-methylase (TrmA/RlmC/RlmD family)
VPALPPCTHRPPCPGCPRYGEAGLDPALLARLARLGAGAGLAAPEVVGGPRLGYRVRARLMLRGRAASPKLGLFEAGSHRVVDIPRCRVHHPLVNEVAAALRDAVRATRTPPYAETPHAGELRAVQIVVERPTRTAQLVLVGRSREPEPLRPLGEALRAALGGALQGLFWNGNPERTNVILGPHWLRLAGREAVRETIGGASVFFPPGAFGQANLDLADRIVERIHARVPEGARAVELYAGCGPIGLGLLGRAAAWTFVESAPEAVRGLRMGLAARPAEEQARARVAEGDAAAAGALLAGADLVVADPPRSGIDAPLLTALAAEPPERLLYLSCDLASLEAQAERLLAGGRLRLAELVAFDLFPNTAHVETLACFERR